MRFRKKAGGYKSKRESNEPILIEDVSAAAGSGQPVRRVVCTCGKCSCRKHHCPVHHSTTGAMIVDNGLKVTYAPKTDYQTTFQPINPIGCRPSMKIPPRVLHRAPPTIKHDLLTVNRQEYKQHPPQPKTVSFKPPDFAHTTGVKLEGGTSYKIDFPPRKMDQISRPHNRALQPTIHRDPELPVTDNYVTMNQKMLKEWSGYHCPPAYGEPESMSIFNGQFDGKTVFQNDFKVDILRNGRPSTSCKKVEKTHVNGEKFYSETTNKSEYTLPKITTREQVHLRKEPQKNRETLDPSQGKMDGKSQYQRDNPGFGRFPAKQSICEPQPDNLQLFTGKRAVITENRASYNAQFLQNPPQPRTSFKQAQLRHANGGNFDDCTSFKVDFQPIPKEHYLAQSQVGHNAAVIGQTHKNGARVKRAQDFGERFSDKTTNKTHFKSWSVGPRVRYGDLCERVFHPSQKPFNNSSETQSSFVPMTVVPAESCKPLDLRFKQESGLNGGAVTGKTAYSDDFLPKPLPLKEQCPAELLLW